MNTSTQNLEADHVHILQLTSVMITMSSQKESDVVDLELVVQIIRNFADQLHHAKEENLLFPAMAEKGFKMEQGPIAMMLSDHQQGRSYVKGMSENILGYKNGDKHRLPLIYQNMDGYAELLQAHISKENNVLFRMADNVFSTQDQQDLLESFAAIDKTPIGGLTASDYVNQINFLVDKYLKSN